MRALTWFVLGILVTIGALFAGGYLFLRGGGMPMETTAAPLPLERTVARMALHASLRGSASLQSPVAADDTNMVAGARTYRDNCAVCHGVPGGKPSLPARGMFPAPPQLFDEDMVTDDPVGETFWKITHGIRMTGMPGFGKTLSDTSRWQVALILARADRLSPAVQSALAVPRQ